MERSVSALQIVFRVFAQPKNICMTHATCVRPRKTASNRLDMSPHNCINCKKNMPKDTSPENAYRERESTTHREESLINSRSIQANAETTLTQSARREHHITCVTIILREHTSHPSLVATLNTSRESVVLGREWYVQTPGAMKPSQEHLQRACDACSPAEENVQPPGPVSDFLRANANQTTTHVISRRSPP